MDYRTAYDSVYPGGFDRTAAFESVAQDSRARSAVYSSERGGIDPDAPIGGDPGVPNGGGSGGFGTGMNGGSGKGGRPDERHHRHRNRTGRGLQS